MVAVLQWRYASQKVLRAVHAVLARIHQPLVLLTIQGAMHAHLANTPILQEIIIFNFARIARQTGIQIN